MSKTNKRYQEILKSELSTLDNKTRKVLSDELHRQVKSKFDRRHVVSTGIDDIWSCDLMEMGNVASSNKGYKYSLNIVDVFSKYAWVIPLTDKTASTMVKAFQSVFNEGRKPKKIWVDSGGEFYNKQLQTFLAKYNITLYSTFSESKSVVVERFNRTIKDAIYRHFTADNTNNWINYYPTFLEEYNNRVHSTIKMSPVEASKEENIDAVRRAFAKNGRETLKPPSFDVGENVRISRMKNTFEKGYDHNWSLAIYTVFQVLPTTPPTYRLTDGAGNILIGTFYAEELQYAKSFDMAFKPEKIVKVEYVNKIPFNLVHYQGKSDAYDRLIPL